MNTPSTNPFILSLFILIIHSEGVIESRNEWRMRHIDDGTHHLTSPHPSTPISSRHKRYVIRRKRWTKRALRWKLQPKLITEADQFIVRNTLHRAFNDWAAVSSVDFHEVSHRENADIEIAFEKGSHADLFPFDGPDGIVAHAFYPRDGRLHFDADEEWTLNSKDGVNLYQTAVHEIGHLLGLEHSSDPRAAMFSAKRSYDVDFGLADDDVRAIRKLFPPKNIQSTQGGLNSPMRDDKIEEIRFIKHPRVIHGLILQKGYRNKKIPPNSFKTQIISNRIEEKKSNKTYGFPLHSSLWPQFFYQVSSTS